MDFLDTGQKHGSLLHICLVLTFFQPQWPTVRWVQSFPPTHTADSHNHRLPTKTVYPSFVLHVIIVWKLLIKIGEDTMISPHSEFRAVFQSVHPRTFSLRRPGYASGSKGFCKGLSQMNMPTITTGSSLTSELNWNLSSQWFPSYIEMSSVHTDFSEI